MASPSPTSRARSSPTSFPPNAIQSIEVISGAPPAEYGGKTSLVIVATTRSGQGVTKPTGDINASYGTFGSATGGFDLSYGGKSWGNFIEADGLNTGRFLDPPEFTVFHDKGNEENFFDRVDYSFTPPTPSTWISTTAVPGSRRPTTYDNLNVQNVDHSDAAPAPTPSLVNVGNTDQASKINTYQHLAHLHAHHQQRLGLQPRRICPQRRSTATIPAATPSPTWARQPSNLVHRPVPHARPMPGSTADYSYVKGINNLKIGVAIRTDLPARTRQPGHRRVHL